MLLFKEVEELGINSFACGFNIWDDDKKAATAWMASKDRLQPPFKTNSTEDVYLLFLEAEKRGESLFILEQKGKELEEHYKYLVTIPEVKKLSEAGLSFPTYQIIHCAYFSKGYLMFITLEPVPDAHDVFKRFAKVFEQTYTRFLDLKKAEAQVREAQIEAALEKVRSRSLAMHSSNELNDVVSILFEKLKELQIPATAVGIGIYIEGSKDLDSYVCGENEAGLVITNYRLPYFNNKISKEISQAFQKQLDFFVGHYSKKEKDSFYKYLLEHTPEFRHLPEDIKHMIFESPTYTISMVAVRNAVFNINDFEGKLLSDNEVDIIKRFARVFEQAYTRFLDLQKAERQAKEAQIEAALERVRSRSMAMHKSEELADLSLELVKQVQVLGEATWFCAFNIYDDDPRGSLEWGSNGQGTFPQYRTPKEGVFLRYYKAGQQGKELLINEIGPEVCATHYDYLCSLPGVGEQLLKMKHDGIPFPESQIDHVAFFKYGYVLFITYDPVPELHDVFKRFAKVFEQSYTRFLDLEKAEAQAKEAQMEMTLEKVRSGMMAMHKSEELRQVIKIIFEQLQLLGFQADASAVIIYDENYAAEHWFSGYSYETYPKSYTIPYIKNFAYNTDLVDAWKKGIEYQSFPMKGKRKTDYGHWLLENTNFKDLPEEFTIHAITPDLLVLNDAFNKYGMLEVLGPEALSEEYAEILKRF